MIPEYQTRILDIKLVARDTKKFIFSKPDGWTYKPGQFLSLKFTERAYRAYSIASHPDEKNLELVIRLVEGGLGSTVLATAKIGDEFIFRGAFGHFGLTKNLCHPEPDLGSLSTDTKLPVAAHLIFCATGTGIAPFRSMVLDEMKQINPRQMTILYGGRNAADIAYLDEIRSWSSDLRIFLALSKEPDQSVLDTWSEKISATVMNGRITDYLVGANPCVCLTEPTATFYICGNGAMVMSVREILLAQGLDKKQIIQERFN